MAHGAAFVHAAESLPFGAGATKTPKASLITHGSTRGSLESSEQAVLQRWYPELHWKSQFTLSHVGVAFAGGEHGVHEAPQLFTDALLSHVPLQLWKPPLHVNPQFVPSHVALAFAGAVHAVHDGPQCTGSFGSTHWPEQTMSVELSHVGPLSRELSLDASPIAASLCTSPPPSSPTVGTSPAASALVAPPSLLLASAVEPPVHEELAAQSVEGASLHAYAFKIAVAKSAPPVT